ncbi:2Fe-2S iron-sulfur cluster-binding protein [Streptomyces sp. NPDC088387]|uniref:2Fe-2S iron-sulfur cluster-binding protein n=1 Tax=Streptomyces sp. NPDC088387 TaxID=3365859 RepID=UPI0038127F7D
MTAPEDNEVGAHVVRVLPLDLPLAVRPDETLMAAAQRHGYAWPTRCRGQALCTACLFEAYGPEDDFTPPGPAETQALETLKAFRDRREGRVRLGCQARPLCDTTVFKRGVRTETEPRRPHPPFI